MSSQSIVTLLTPNSNSVATSQSSQAVSIQLQTNGISYWNATVSSTMHSAILPNNTGNASVTFKQGLTVTYLATSGSSYSITLSGQIVDNSQNYNLTGLNIGTFTV